MEKVSTIATLASRKPKWQYPTAQPTPRILNFPRRPRRKPLAKTSGSKSSSQKDRKVKLETLFDQEREFARGVRHIVMVGCEDDDESEEERRERVQERDSLVVEEERWRFQAEMLRAECNLLRMEREIAAKKMGRRRVQAERALRSAVQTLLSGRKKIYDGKNVRIVLEEDIIELAEKLEKLQRRSKHKVLEVKNCSNFDKQASFLQRQLEKSAGGESDKICVKEIQEMAEASLTIKTACNTSEDLSQNGCTIMEILKRKMEGLSRESLIERMEEENSCASTSTTASKQIELPEISSSSTKQSRKEEKACSGCCKAIVRRVVEQVRAETEQWSQMQEMLGQVRDEIEELQASRDFWEDRALNSDQQIQFLQSAVKEWRRKAMHSEAKTNELQAQVSMLHAEIERWRKEKAIERNRTKTSHNSPNEMEKRVLVCRLKENRHGNDEVCKQKEVSLGDGRKKSNACNTEFNASKRSPLREIGNSSPLHLRQNSRAVFPLHSPLPLKEKDNF